VLSVGAHGRDLKRVTDQGVVPGPPAELQWPPEAEGAGPPTTRSISGWMKWLVGLGVVIVVVALAGTFIRIPYDTLAPGGALDLQPRISVRGAKTYPGRGELMLLFVRERSHINLWTWLQAKLDPEIDLVKQEDVTGGLSQHLNDLQGVCDMSQSQIDAQVAALRSLGYRVPTLPGLAVSGLLSNYPYKTPTGTVNTIPLGAAKVLEPCDEVFAADGHVIKQPDELSKIIKSHEPGTDVTLSIERNGKRQTVRVPVTAVPGNRLIGVDLALRYHLPVQIKVDTSDISGPSAGLAMTLAIIDDLTPGDLTGGKKVAVTGTIDARGNVGPIGGIAQKAIAARRAGAQVFIVPACQDRADRECASDLETAKKRVGDGVEFAPVSTLAQALKVLRAAGGSPVRVPAAA
jgi:PDZ domain-containing protein